MDFKATEWQGSKYTIQVAPEDCTGCTLCMMVCPAKDKSNPKHKALDMAPQAPLREAERANYDFFLDLPEVDRTKLRIADVKSAQFLQPLFEYSGACAGCGETPYIKLLTQLFGDRTMIANATGCSSIYGANLPTTPYAVNKDGRGPTWSNSLFEDNAEFGLGMRLGVDHHALTARDGCSRRSAAEIGQQLVDEILAADQSGEAGIAAQRARVAELKKRLGTNTKLEAKRLVSLADYLVKKSVWIVGGDGWAYDIGFGGLDHVLAVGRDVNILVLDTEVYSNTGGQSSKSTPLGASAKFATAGKAVSKKDLALMAMGYGSVYVARVAFGAKDAQTVKAFQEAESYPGTSIILAYSPCIAHGYDMAFQLDQQTKAVQSGYWPLYRFDPRRTAAGETPLVIDTGALKGDIGAFMRNEARFRVAEERDPGGVQGSRRAGAQGGRRQGPPLRAARQEARRRGRDPARELRTPHMDLRTTYLGLPLAHPLMPGASPLVDDLDTVKRLEDAGASAIVMHSLFEEQITRENEGIHRAMERPCRVLRGGPVLLPGARGVPPRPRPVSRADPEDPRDRRDPRHRVAERRDGLGLAELREAHAGGRRARARAERLPHRGGPERARHDDRARRSRTSSGRSSAASGSRWP